MRRVESNSIRIAKGCTGQSRANGFIEIEIEIEIGIEDPHLFDCDGDPDFG
jgi:hypothetical protein